MGIVKHRTRSTQQAKRWVNKKVTLENHGKPRDTSKWWQQKDKTRGFSQLQLWGRSRWIIKKAWPQTDEKLKLTSFLRSHIDFSNLICKYFPPKPKKWSKNMQRILFHHAILIISPKFCHVSSLRSRFSPQTLPLQVTKMACPANIQAKPTKTWSFQAATNANKKNNRLTTVGMAVQYPPGN